MWPTCETGDLNLWGKQKAMSGTSEEFPLVPMGLASASTGLWRRWLSSLPPTPCWLAGELQRLRMAGLDVKLLRPSIGLINIFAFSLNRQVLTFTNVWPLGWWCYRFELYRGLLWGQLHFPTFRETQVQHFERHEWGVCKVSVCRFCNQCPTTRCHRVVEKGKCSHLCQHCVFG